MFYVKEQLNDAMEVSVEINDENVYCRCPKCGCEVQVILMSLMNLKKPDLLMLPLM